MEAMLRRILRRARPRISRQRVAVPAVVAADADAANRAKTVPRKVRRNSRGHSRTRSSFPVLRRRDPFLLVKRFRLLMKPLQLPVRLNPHPRNLPLRSLANRNRK